MPGEEAEKIVDAISALEAQEQLRMMGAISLVFSSDEEGDMESAFQDLLRIAGHDDEHHDDVPTKSTTKNKQDAYAGNRKLAEALMGILGQRPPEPSKDGSTLQPNIKAQP